jgi:exopolyphosphatase/guanosine-5'-triphosphate,3'-diphosphate pyrophosphatase
MKKRTAILDLGTNTFHLLIAEVNESGTWQVLYKAEEYVHLGEEGLEKIGGRAFERGVEQIRKYQTVMDELKPAEIRAFGTAAIRTASNGSEFVQAITSVCPMTFTKISGDEEAELIYLGVREAVKLDEHPVLIMDIGGGSTEFIIANRDQLFWKQSFKAGGSILKQRFHHREPISAIEQVNLIHYLQHELAPLHAAVKNFPIRHLIGASGSFDTLAQMMAENFSPAGILTPETHHDLPIRHFYHLCEELLRSTYEQRRAMKGLVWFRAETIVAASILAAYIVESFNIYHLTHSAYALKEGVLRKMMQGQH